MSKPVVAIVGRPNVGKSTLFNRIVGGLVAIVENTPGVTRDRLYFDAEWLGRKFTLIDTGGIEFKDETTPLSSKMKQQAEIAVDEADVIMFLVDAKSGITPDDQQIARYLRKSSKPVLLVANKVEKFTRFEAEAHEFLPLGFGDPIPVSAVHGMNTGDLLDTLVSALPEDAAADYDPDVIKIAVIGRPNVGKSSIVNMLLGEERVIVSDIPGTTRDAIDTPFTYEDRNYVLIDTAGIRRKKKISEVTENYSVVRSFRAVDRSDVVLMVINAIEGVTDQDKKIVGYAHEAGKGLILVINKWDLVIKDEKTINKYEKDIREELAFVLYAPTQFVSAKTGQRINKIMDLVEFVAEQTSRRISTSTLNNLLREWVHLNPPPSDKGVRLKILYATQSSVQPPTFIFFVNDPELVHFSYKRYLENQLRKNFGFEGSPIRMIMRKRDEEKQ
ncbi:MULTISPECIES: ribosome biogenesis GTPase Der [Dehalobacter]|uniref:GTPase Der n=2 Tax=Dehalobacter restrictus TaxID=55583 RepID=A0A857DK78_9FIRM|nr:MULTISPECIES: ribosome biogenesis GTPase Der [Dehalobacter]AHF10273.1 GTP-binding protein Der [Dehalobacter restrictus DSM 9455]EQB20797.1 GTP-binding protein EngA [Dehalobacter sp. UNSWDHB]MCG1024281.1 ribosome biogenesis GTPase Der [Dehalobacter sp.]MDJ0306078.1 ribosome biogenesis GTPase Der [Dehalobacter sp.]QHA00859.1 ribosome biogenesis GTPase Der [Dehalobacter restrictus]